MPDGTTRMPTYFISHGGGPWPWLEHRPGFDYGALRDSLARMPGELPAPAVAVLCVSGHWEAAAFTVMTSAAPTMYYDYYGFPEHTYRISYRAPGAPLLAGRVGELLGAAGIELREDGERGFDHGTFVPLAVMYPEADLPVVQLSIRADFDPEAHLALGRALAPLRDEGVLVVGSGLSFHNLRALGPVAKEPSARFDEWLTGTVVDGSPAERAGRLAAWEQAPFARFCHPREDHLIPLLVAAGAAEEEAAVRTYHETGFAGGVTASSYRFG